MQMYVLTQLRYNLKENRLDPLLFRPVVQNKLKYNRLHDAGYPVEIDSDEVLIYKPHEVVQAEPGTDLWDETSAICMMMPCDCRIDIETFYLFKITEGEPGYAREMLQDFTLFEPYLPLF